MKKRIKLLSLILCVVLGFVLIAGCKEVGVKTEIYDRSTDWVLKTFIAERVVDGGNVIDGQYLNCGSQKFFLVDNKEEFDCIFKTFPVQINFENERIVVYCFNCIYNGCDYKVNAVNVKEDRAVIEIEHVSPNSNEPIGYTTSPTFRIITIRLFATDFNNVSINVKGETL